MTTTRQCERCDITLVRKTYPSGPETLFKFTRRRFCSPACANVRQPKPAPKPAPKPPARSLAASYRAALALGIDPFELADACWEA